MGSKFTKLAQAVRAISPVAEISVRGIPSRDDWWICTVRVSSVILVESSAAPMDYILDETLKKIKSMSQRMHAIIDESEPPISE